MSKVYPLYILVASFVFFLTILFFKHNKEVEKEKRFIAVKKLETKAQKFTTLKQHWKDKKRMRARLFSILSTPPLSQFVKEKRVHHNKMFVTLLIDNPTQSDRALEQILNSFVQISKISMKKRENNITVDMEFDL